MTSLFAAHSDRTRNCLIEKAISLAIREKNSKKSAQSILICDFYHGIFAINIAINTFF